MAPRAPLLWHAALGAFALALASSEPILEPEEFVNPLCGSFTDGARFSTGNTLPLVARPWGAAHWSVQTSDGRSSWWFDGNAHVFRWLRLTHQPSPWIGDWGWMLFGPQMGGRVEQPTMFWEPRAAHFKPHVLEATLAPDNMRVSLTATDHGAVLKVGFPAYNPAGHGKRICFQMSTGRGPGRGRYLGDDAERMTLDMDLNTVPESAPSNFHLHVRAEVDVASLQQLGKMPVEKRMSMGSGNLRCFEFHPAETDVTVWLGTSLLGKEEAVARVAEQVRGRSFEDVVAESKAVWNEALRRVEVVDAGPMTEATFRRLTVFYTGLYRALLFPRRLDEPDMADPSKRMHYSPYDGQGRRFAGVLVTDNGFWDTFRTVYTLLYLVYPSEGGDIAQGWVNAFKEGGWLPQWSSPGYRTSMVGTFSDVVVADAILKDLPGLDVVQAWAAIEKDAFTAGTGNRGKTGYSQYDSLGYIPHDAGVSDGVSLTLDFAFADFAAAKVAEKLGKDPVAKRLFTRASRARQSLFDPETKLMRPKSKTGVFARVFDPSTWGNGYVEGSAWHHSFPPFDVDGLAALHGGKTLLAKKIQEMLQTPGTFRPGGYRQEIHEMTEMRALAMGQYGHNNQPSHHILWLLLQLDMQTPACVDATGSETPTASFCPRRIGEEAIFQVLERAYGIDFYAGDEDNGEMGAWAVLSMLGLFETVPGGASGYTLGSPAFRRMRLWREGYGQGEPLEIVSARAGGLRHVRKVLVDGEEVRDEHWSLGHEALVAAKQVRFVTGAESEQGPPLSRVEAGDAGPAAWSARGPGKAAQTPPSMGAALPKLDPQGLRGTGPEAQHRLPGAKEEALPFFEAGFALGLCLAAVLVVGLVVLGQLTYGSAKSSLARKRAHVV